MQLMPEVASRLGVKDVFDPKQNVAAGAQYLKELLDNIKAIYRKPWLHTTPVRPPSIRPTAYPTYPKPASMWNPSWAS